MKIPLAWHRTPRILRSKFSLVIRRISSLKIRTDLYTDISDRYEVVFVIIKFLEK